MSTPQENPNTGPDDQYPSQGSPEGRTTPEVGANRFDQQNQYGYQGTQPAGYAYPTSGVEAAPASKGPAPKEVMTAYYLILAAGVVYLVSSILSALTTDFSDVAGASLVTALTIGFSIIIAAVYVLLAVFIRKGHNWARITATVLAALNVMFSLAGLLLAPLANDLVESSGQQVTSQSSALGTILSLVVMVLGAAGVIMTYLKPSRPYFAPQKIGY
ncbi:hypothetical protein E8P82_00270 [Arthrobacter echini]|uniref:Sox C-terminal domain-containing protein n=1 Tax=Arthrobacter echini TaxID=1529066 RepID=A0A4S5E9Y3_9MICC|nr:hypothetical protein [Arthrobacter echini]THJ68393.1 hypothetical protein E8P82_00270 [Arthrobacter echini]